MWMAVVPLERFGFGLPPVARSTASLIIGLLILKSACDALVSASERLAASRMWDHYIAGTVAEIVVAVDDFVDEGGLLLRLDA